METESSRERMLSQQIRAGGVIDDAALAQLRSTPREAFVPDAYQSLAFAEENIPLAHDQVMMTPQVEGLMLQALNVQSSDKVLEIGTGSGYFTALLAKSGQHVYSVELFADLLKQAQARLDKLRLTNVTLQEGNGAFGWDRQQPYDVICITGALSAIPSAFKRELAIGGRLFAIVGRESAMSAVLVTRLSEQKWQHQHLFETVVPALLQGPSHHEFSF